MEQKKQLPFEVKPLSEEETSIFKKYWGNTNNVDRIVRVGPKGYIQFGNLDLWTDLYNHPVDSTDIFVASYPRSGTTWTQELVWLVANDFDFETAKSISLTTRYLYFEHNLWINVVTSWCSEEENKILVSVFDQSVPNGFKKTHLPLSLLPANTLDAAKMVYVARDPRDVMVSYYHYNKALKFIDLQSDFQDFFNFFLKNLVILYGPYFEHVKEAWAQRHHPNMLFLFYEELCQDLKGTAKRVAKFLKKHSSEEQLDKLCEHLKFENFQKNSAVNADDLKFVFNSPDEKNFVRKGKVGGWRESFNAEMTQQAERWMEENLKDTDLRFPSFQN